ncbi:MAG: Hsp70 family protein [Pirellulaceae bacterium]|nr:Hsp70 family protein [Pirellulaceae bacterium]
MQAVLDNLDPQTPPRFVVGIDLGTTNCAVAFVDTSASHRSVQTFLIEQFVDWQMVEKRKTLPSFHYQWTEAELNELRSLPHNELGTRSHCVGVYARDRGSQNFGRLVSSAKSWLCHSGIDRTAPILPWHGDPEAERLSPVVASSRYLEHLRLAWDASHPQHPLSTCDVVLTLPASFDEVARELTIEAARLAGLPRIVLIEEPQAAFYAWLNKNEEDWQQSIQPGQTVLICDIGGGTTDFTLIRVRNAEGDSDFKKYGLHRVAVGQHLMLGGDNFDLALTKAVEPLFQTHQPLEHREFEALRLQCRVHKEAMLGNHPPARCVISLSGKGSRLIGNIRSVEVSFEMIEKTLLDGFFPSVELESTPLEAESGLLEFGLPYEADPAITRHLAQFLWEHRWAGREDGLRAAMDDRLAARPDWILFNGGVLESPQIRNRLRKQVEAWFASDANSPVWHVGELEPNQLDLAVAIGAAYFGLVRRGEGVRIDARLARAYYLQIATDPPQAMCIMPGDANPLDRFVLSEHPFELEIGRPVQFPIFVSSTHLVHRVGEIIPIDFEWMRPLPPIHTVLESSRHRRNETIPIVMETELTEIGTLDLSLVTAGSDRTSAAESPASMRWRLAFDLRSSVETDRSAHLGTLEQTGIVDSELKERAARIIRTAFEPEASIDHAKNLVKSLVNELAMARRDWKPSLLRSMWQDLIDCVANPKLSIVKESRLLNLLGFCLRPGYGFAADDWRVAMTWRLVQGKLKHPSNAAEAMVLWRRIAGGFTAGQQRALYQEVQTRVREILEGRIRAAPSNQEAMELLRLVGSLELLSLKDKMLLGDLAIKALGRNKLAPLHNSILWMLGRIGARSLVYGPLNDVMQPEQIVEWIRKLCELDAPQSIHHLALMQLTRRTGDRYRDVSTELRELSIRTLDRWQAPESYRRLVSEVTDLNQEQSETIVGESVPLGIRLR